MSPLAPVRPARVATVVRFVALATAALVMVVLVAAAPARAQSPIDSPVLPEPTAPQLDAPSPGSSTPDPVADDTEGIVNFSVDLGGGDEEARPPGSSLVLIIGLTLLSVAPSLVVMLTSFTRIVIVFSLVRSAMGVQSIPPNQVVVGLSLFLSLFIMGPTLSQMNEVGLQPYLDGEKTQSEAYDDAVEPLRDFMFANTGTDELELMLAAQGNENPPEGPDDVSMTALIPAFILSELKACLLYTSPSPRDS